MEVATTLYYMILLTVSDRVRIWQGIIKFDPGSGELRDEQGRVVGATGEGGKSSGESGQQNDPNAGQGNQP